MLSFLLGMEEVEFLFQLSCHLLYFPPFKSLLLIYNYICHPFLKTANTTTKVLQFSICQNYLLIKNGRGK